jgi:4-amino-4-deoxy-L-arabinose transferase-like glycosyltransferase
MYEPHTLLCVVGAMGVGVALWCLLFRGDLSPEHARQRMVITVLCAALAVHLVFSLATPTFRAPDEVSHFRYVEFLVKNHAFPIQGTSWEDRFQRAEFYQSPIYYLLLTPAYGLMRDGLDLGDWAVVRVLRLLSIGLWCITVLLTLRLCRRLDVVDDFLETGCLCMVALLPTHVFISSVINNDNLLILLATAIIYQLAQPQSLTRSLGVGLLLGLALLTKVSALSLVVPIFTLWLLRWLTRMVDLREAVRHSVLMVIPGLVLFAPWALRNLELYGSFTAITVGNVPLGLASTWDAATESAAVISRTFWTAAGRTNSIWFLPQLGIALGCFALAGIGVGAFWRRRELLETVSRSTRVYLAALGIGLVFSAATVFHFATVYRQPQGRFLYPYLVPIALFFGAGLKAWRMERWLPNASLHMAGLFMTYLFGFCAYCMVRFGLV